jgi:hypothetical protein
VGFARRYSGQSLGVLGGIACVSPVFIDRDVLRFALQLCRSWQHSPVMAPVRSCTHQHSGFESSHSASVDRQLSSGLHVSAVTVVIMQVYMFSFTDTGFLVGVELTFVISSYIFAIEISA